MISGETIRFIRKRRNLTQGRILVDDNAGPQAWAKAYRRIHNDSVSDVRIDTFRDDFLRMWDAFIAYNAF